MINDDEILVADQWNHRVQQFNVQSAPSFVNSFGRLGTEDGNFRNPASVCIDDEGRIIVSDFNKPPRSGFDKGWCTHFDIWR